MTLISKKYDTLLLLHMEGESGASIIDSSPYGHSVASYRQPSAGVIYADHGAMLDQNEKPFGVSSCRFCAIGDDGAKYLKIPYHSVFDLGTGDFTIEYFHKSDIYRPTGWYQCLFYCGNLNLVIGQREAYESLQYPGSYIYLAAGGIGQRYFTWYPHNPFTNLCSWEHHAWVRYGGNLSFYKDGILQGTQDIAGMDIAGGDFYAGLHPGTWGVGSGVYPLYGWLKEVRLLNYAKYTSEFTPPTGAHEDEESLSFGAAASLSCTYSLTYAHAWLSGYMARYRITVDRTKFFTDRVNYYLPLLICNDTGMNRVDLTGIFTSVGSYAKRKEIAITLEDQVTEVPVKIHTWSHGRLAHLFAVVPKVYCRDWHRNAVLYFYYKKSTSGDNPMVTDI